MKNIDFRILASTFLAAAFCLLSCNKTPEQDWSSQIDDIYSRLWKIENPRINTIQEQLDTMRASFPKLDAADEAFKAYSDSLTKSLSSLSAALPEIEAKTTTLYETFDKAISDAASTTGPDTEAKIKKINTVRDDVLAQIDGARVLTYKVFSELNNAVKHSALIDVAFRTDIADTREYVETISSDDWAKVSVSTLDCADKLAADLANINALAKGLNSTFSELQSILSVSLRNEVAAAMNPVLTYFSKDLASEIIGDYARATYTASVSLEKAYASELSTSIAIASEHLRNSVNPALGEYGALVEADSLFSHSCRWLEAQLYSQKAYLEDIASSAFIAVETGAATEDNNNAKEELNSSSAQLHSDLSSGSTLLQEEYRKAIQEAINSNEGRLKGKIAVGVVEANISAWELLKGIESEETSLNKRTAGVWSNVSIVRKSLIQSDTDELISKIDEIARRIQSITFMPEYSDGKASAYYRQADDGTIIPMNSRIRFDIRPSSAAEELADVWQQALSLRGIYTLTRVSGGDEFDLSITNVVASNGRLDITFRSSSIEECFFENKISASLCLLVSQGNSQKSSSYIPLIPKSLNWIEIPDAVFRDYLLEMYDTDGDGNISTYEAAAVKELNLSDLAENNYIHSLEGIIYFTGLETLNWAGHHLTSLDLTSNTKLVALNCKGNELTQVNLTNCSALETIDLSDNNLSNIDVSKCSALKGLNLDNNNELKELDVINNKALENLSAKNTSLTLLDLTDNPALTRVNIFAPLSQKISVMVLSQDWLSSITVIANYGTTYYERDIPFFFNGSIEIDGVIWKQYDSKASGTDPYGGTATWGVAKEDCPSGWKLPARGDFAGISENSSPWTEFNGLNGRWFSGSQPYSESVPAVFLNATNSGSDYGVYWGNDYVGDRTLNALYFNESRVNPNYTGYTFEFSNDRFGSRCVKE